MSYRIWRDYASCDIEWTDDDPDDHMTFATFGEAKARLLGTLRDGRDQLRYAIAFVQRLSAKTVRERS